MSNDLIPYQDFKVLIIEDLAEMRSSMKAMLAALGVQDIVTTSNGEDALRYMQSTKFDIVFSDYELGKGKDGQQVLEEVRSAGLIDNTAIYILVTAAQTMEMVMGALESAPDGYIVKPVTLVLLRSRLTRIIRTKWVYREINLLIDKKDTEGALEACTQLALQRPKFVLPAYRIKGRILIDANRYQEAKDHYGLVLEIKRVAWAILGMGKAHFYLGEYEEAKELLEGLANTNDKYVESLDWLAKTLAALGRYKAAQIVLGNAVAASPKSYSRQQYLALIAELNGDTEVVMKSCRKAIALGKNTALARPEPYISLARGIQMHIKSGSMRESKMAYQEARNILDEARSLFEFTPVQNLKWMLVEAETLANTGDEVLGLNNYTMAMQFLEQSTELSLDDKIDAFGTRLMFDEPEVAEEAKQSLLSEIGSDIRLQIKLYRIIENFLIDKPEQRLTILLEWGQELLDKDYVEDATYLLLRASQYPNANNETKLLLFQSIITKFSKKRFVPSLKDEALGLIRGFEALDESSNDYARYQELKTQWDNLEHD